MKQSQFDSATTTALSRDNINKYHQGEINDYLLKRRIHEFSVTGTPKPATTSLNDLFITVKTTKLYHETRLALIIKTWFQLAKDQVSELYIIYSKFVFFILSLLKYVISAQTQHLRSVVALQLYIIEIRIQKLYQFKLEL